MEAVAFAERTRAFFRSLFGSGLVVELRHELEQARADVAYFRGRCERLEMRREAELERLTTPPPPVERKHGNLAPIPAFKTFAQRQREKIQENLKRAEEERNKPKEKVN